MNEKMSKQETGKAGSHPAAEDTHSSGESGVRRGRPGRRSADERTTAVVEFLSGKATADQLAFRFGVQPSTVLRWRDLALEAVEASMRQGSGRSVQELDLEKKLRNLEKTFTDLAIRHEILQKVVANRPSGPGKRSR